MNEGILDHKAAGSDAQHQAEASPEDEGAGDDGLFCLGRSREHGHEGSGELKALAKRRGNKDSQIDHRWEMAAEDGQNQTSNKKEEGASDDGPLEAARPGDGEASASTREGGNSKETNKSQARGRGACEKDGLVVQGSEWSAGQGQRSERPVAE